MNLKAFLFSLKDDAKDWLYFLHVDLVTTWKKMKSQFLEKEIYEISQMASKNACVLVSQTIRFLTHF